MATERRAHQRKRVLFGAKAKAKTGETKGIVRDYTEAGACVEFAAVQAPRGEIDIEVARQGRAYKGKVVWTRLNKAGVAFHADSPPIAPDPENDVEARLRKSERHVRMLRNRVRELSGG
jgi:hypothetical protein